MSRCQPLSRCSLKLLTVAYTLSAWTTAPRALKWRDLPPQRPTTDYEALVKAIRDDLENSDGER